MYAMSELIEDVLGVPVGNRRNASLQCPFHRERHPSFSIDLETGLWICFACGERGGYVGLCNRLERAVGREYQIIQARRSVDTRPAPRPDLTALAQRHVTEGDTPQGRDTIRDYLGSKRLAGEVVGVFGLGYEPSKRAISIPYPDLDGRVRGIKYRHRDGSKSAETTSEFGIYQPALASGRHTVIVAEGESDAHSLWSTYRGDPKIGVCATSGSPSGKEFWEQFAVSMLFTTRVYLAQDADEAGDRSAEVAAQYLGSKAFRLRPSAGKDWSDALMAGEVPTL